MRDSLSPLTPPSDAERVISSVVAAIDEVFEVHSVRRRQAEKDIEPLGSSRGVIVELLGNLRVPSEKAYRLISSSFHSHGYIALLRRSSGQDSITAIPGELPSAPARVGLALSMFLATLMSVLFVGSGQAIVENGVWGILSGWPFAASLLGILVAHEFGHYLVSRWFGVATSLPYFIPLPLSFLGTLGAVIRMKSPPHNRRELLAIAAAGPLAGLVVAVPVLIYGLSLSTVATITPSAPYAQEGNSLLYAAIKMLMFGRLLPAGGEDVFLHPVAMAGWTGLLVTALNLIPAGQLDGGHIAYALLGSRARWLVWLVVVALVLLSPIWNGWLIWVGLVLVFGRVHAVPLDDVTRLRTSERALVVIMLIVFALVFTPIPLMIS